MNYRYAALSTLPFVAGSLLLGLGGMENGTGKDGGAVPDCSATMQWFAKPHSLGPLLDHVHTADLVVSDGGKQISLIYTSTQFLGEAPPAPIESFTFWGHRM